MTARPMRSDAAPIFLTHKPSGPLAALVEMFWLWRGDPPPHRRDRMLPTGTASFIVNLADDELRIYESDTGTLARRIEGSGFSGAHLTPFVIDTAEQVYVAGAEFRPGGAWPFMAAAQDEIADVHVALRDLWGVDVASLRERLLMAASDRDRLMLLEQTLTTRLCRAPELRCEVIAAMRAIETDPGIRMSVLERRIPLRRRRLTRLFELQVGTTPKTYARLQRFRRVLHETHRVQVADWSQIALDCGYYDQSHLNLEFKRFSGFTPAQYATLAASPSNHVPIG
jgi:AraC-like DNA-binding protein